jgi:hypothetical protein
MKAYYNGAPVRPSGTLAKCHADMLEPDRRPVNDHKSVDLLARIARTGKL